VIFPIFQKGISQSQPWMKIGIREEDNNESIETSNNEGYSEKTKVAMTIAVKIESTMKAIVKKKIEAAMKAVVKNIVDQGSSGDCDLGFYAMVKDS